MVMWLYRRKLLIACNQPDRFGGHMHCGSEDIFLIYHVTSRDHVFNGFCDFMCESFS